MMSIEEKLNGKIRVLPLQRLSGAKIAAITESLKTNAREVTLAFFEWEPTITLSFYQSIKDVNMNFAVENGYSVVRLLGGGRAYIHNGDVSFVLVIPGINNLLAVDNYKPVASRFISAFNKLGLYASTKEKSGNDVYSGDKVLMGLAQDCTGGSMMMHGAFYYDEPPYDVAAGLINGYSKDASKKLQERISYFRERSSAGREELLSTIISSFGNVYIGKLSLEEKKSLTELEDKYSSIEYNSKGSQSRGLCWLPEHPYPFPRTFND